MLSKVGTFQQGHKPNLQLIFRDYNTINYIPSYEGDQLESTLTY